MSKPPPVTAGQSYLGHFSYFTADCDSLGAAGYHHHVRNSLMYPVSRAAAATYRARSNVSPQHIKSDTQRGRFVQRDSEATWRSTTVCCKDAFHALNNDTPVKEMRNETTKDIININPLQSSNPK